MLTDTELRELSTAPTESLVVIVRIMARQIAAPLLIGDRARSEAMRDEALRLLAERGARA